jgi:hypothetical protein
VEERGVSGHGPVGGKDDKVTEPENVSTRLQRIAQLAREDQDFLDQRVRDEVA